MGLGGLAVWGSALLFWVEIAQSPWWVKSVLGYIGAAATSGTMLSLYLYASSLEKRLADRVRVQQDPAEDRRSDQAAHFFKTPTS